ncbi:alpha/beta hydrolase fold-3 [Lucifera butyrica]|uniref:Alpha/beta hydrolase fold-3 n=1 Tax=Lucifera butyrica TaxID=1351585 RepID=A0A498RB06_9FIRM|nr:alpha/beta hydrolase [Lucifera butyrica]VBB08621.1 alpha/beta hydrolase fold-3 [Lucifera butyrica]
MGKKTFFLRIGILVLSLMITAYSSQALASVTQDKKVEVYNFDNRINSELREAFSGMPVLDYVKDVVAFREAHKVSPTTLPTDDAVLVREETISGYEGIPDLKVRTFQPKTRSGNLPAVLWIHGGGYILGSAEAAEGLILRIVKEGNCVVVAPNYRLAPENTFPAAIDDCYATLKWMADNSKNNLMINTERIAVAGTSAGGGLTAAVALKARDEKGPSICFEMPLYPMLDDRNVTASSYQVTDGRVWNREDNVKAWGMYLGNGNGKKVSPYAAPARATDLSGLPPTFIMIGELDVFRDEVIDYANRLMQAGVPTELHIYPGCFHGFEIFIPQAEISKKAKSEYIGALTKAINR